MALFIVSNLNDSGIGSLRQAIQDAGNNGEADTIMFDASITQGVVSGVDDGLITLTSGVLQINSEITVDGDVDGDSKADIMISGNDASQIFNIMWDGDATLRSLHLTEGWGRISGGAISTYTSGKLALISSTITHSYAEYFGGAVSGRDVRIFNSTFYGNTAGISGGALGAVNGLTLVNSTVYGNTSYGYGGGIAAQSPALISNSTITGNTANSAGGIYMNYGGGSYMGARGARFENSILAGNTALNANSAATNDLAGILLSTSSLLGTNVAGDNSNIFSDAPGLGPLSDNGGPVLTMALLPGSPAISAGDANLLPPDTVDVDLDGIKAEAVPRDANGNGRIFGTLDLGATEVLPAVGSVILRNADGEEEALFSTVRAALLVASECQQIELADIYASNTEEVPTDLDDLVFDVAANTGVTISFAGSEDLSISATGRGSVTFRGNDGDNTFVMSNGDASLRGGEGFDTADYSSSSGGIFANLTTGAANGGAANGDTFVSIEALIGAAGQDTLVGNLSDNALVGGESSDVLLGRGGDDTLLGENGADTISAGSGADSVTAGDGADMVIGQGQSDTIDGGIGNDTLRGGSGNDEILGGADDDALFGQGNNDTLDGGVGNDMLAGAAGSDVLRGGSGEDTLTGGNGSDRLDGGVGNDTLNGGGADGVRDFYVFALGYERDRINAFDQAGTDLLQLDEDLWTGTQPGLTEQQVIDTFGSLNATGTILTLDFGAGDLLEIQNANGIDQTTLGTDVQFV